MDQTPTTLKATGAPLWRLQLIRALQILGVAGGFIGGADFLQLVSILPPGFAAWFLLVGPAFVTASHPIIMLLGDMADDGIKNDSFKLPAVLFLVGSLSLFTVACGTSPALSFGITPDGCALANYTAANGQHFQAGPQIGEDGKIAAYVTQWTTVEGVTVRATRATKGGKTVIRYKDPLGSWAAWDSKAGLSLGAVPTATVPL